jgi:hypothetical protein
MRAPSALRAKDIQAKLTVRQDELRRHQFNHLIQEQGVSGTTGIATV